MSGPGFALVDVGDGNRPAGVGFAVGPRTVVTCHHVLRRLGEARGNEVIAEGSQVALTFRADGRTRVARVVVDDAGADVAVLRVPRTAAPPRDLTVLRLVDPRVQAQVDVYGYPRTVPKGRGTTPSWPTRSRPATCRSTPPGACPSSPASAAAPSSSRARATPWGCS
nr:hypothetical protein GCM10025730_52230 [Promicromonospora thailandica]